MAPIIASVVRHVLTLLAGGLLSIGVQESQTQDLVKAIEPVASGAILYGISQIWSIKEKKKVQ